MEHYYIVEPNLLLAPYIRYYWMLEVDSDVLVTERTIPFGYNQLIFHRGCKIFSSTDGALQPLSFLCGMSTGYKDLLPTGKIKMLVVAFHPEGARAFFRIPMCLFHNSDVPLDALSDKALNELANRVTDEPDDLKCVAMIESFLIKRLYDFDDFNRKRLLPAIHAINRDCTIHVSALSGMACLSQKQFNRIFTEYVGSNPKEFHRLVRFQRALFILQNNPSLNLAQLAFDAGYYDQPHLIKDFKQFSGYTPREFLAVCAPHSDYFSYL